MVRHDEVINPGGDRPVYYGADMVDTIDLFSREEEICLCGTSSTTNLN